MRDFILLVVVVVVGGGDGSGGDWSRLSLNARAERALVGQGPVGRKPVAKLGGVPS